MNSRWPIVCVTMLTLAVAACAGGDDDDNNTFPQPSPSPSPSATPTVTPTPPTFDFQNSYGFRANGGAEMWLLTEAGFTGKVSTVRVAADWGMPTYYNVVQSFGEQPVSPGRQLWLVDENGATPPPTPGVSNYRFDIDYVYGVGSTSGGWYTEIASTNATAPAAIVSDNVPSGDGVVVTAAVTASCGAPNFLRFVVQVTSDVLIDEVRIYEDSATDPALMMFDGAGGPLVCQPADDPILYTGATFLFDACEFVGPTTLPSGTYRAMFLGQDLVEGDDYFQFFRFTYNDFTQGSCFSTP